MITDWQVQYHGSSILIGIAVQHAILDIHTDAPKLKTCLALLNSPHAGLVSARIGSFGTYPVTLNLQHNDDVSVFVDGPKFAMDRSQSAAVWIEKDQLCRMVDEVLARSPETNPEN